MRAFQWLTLLLNVVLSRCVNQDALWCITQTLSALSDEDDDLFRAAKRTLEMCASTQLAHVMLDNELGSEKLSYALFKALTDHIVPSNAQAIQQPAVQVLVDLLQQSEAVPFGIIIALGAKLANESDSQSAVARLLERVVQRGHETIDIALGRIARAYVCDDNKELQKVHRTQVPSVVSAIAKHCASAVHSASYVLAETLNDAESYNEGCTLSACTLASRLMHGAAPSGVSNFQRLFRKMVALMAHGATDAIRIELVRWARGIALEPQNDLAQNSVQTLVAALGERVLDSNERVRRESSVSLCEIAEHLPNRITASELQRAADRLWDKKQSVRRDVYKHICKAHMAYLKRMSRKCVSSAEKECFEWIVPTLLDAAKAREMAPTIFESAFVDDAIQLSKLPPETLAHSWCSAWMHASYEARDVLKGMLKSRCQLRSAMQAYFDARKQRRSHEAGSEYCDTQPATECEDDHGNGTATYTYDAKEERIEDIGGDAGVPNALFERLGHALPGIDDAEERMARLHAEIKDGHFYRSLKVAMNQDAGEEAAQKTLQEVVSRAGGLKKPNGEFARQLCQRLFNAPFTSGIVTSLCSIDVSDANRRPAYCTASLELAQLVSELFPSLFKGCLNHLSTMVQANGLHSAIRTNALQILGNTGKACQAHESKRARGLMPTLKTLCRGHAADRKQAKAAADALFAIGGSNELSSVVQDATFGLPSDNDADRSLHIASAGKAFILDHSLFADYAEDFVGLFRMEAKNFFDGNIGDVDLKALVATAKAISRALTSARTDASTVITACREMMQMYNELLLPSNATCSKEARIEIALQVLRMAERVDSEMPMSLLISALLSLGGEIGNPTKKQMERAILKVYNRIIRGVVPGKWSVSLALAASQHQEAADALCKCIARFRHRALGTESLGSSTPLATMPEYMLPFLTCAVAANPGFPSQYEADDAVDTMYIPFAEDLASGLEALLEGSGTQPAGATLPALLKMLRHTKLCISVDDNIASSDKVHNAADLGILVTKLIASRQGWDTSISFPGQVPIPNQLLKPEQASNATGKAPITAARKTDGGTLPHKVDVSTMEIFCGILMPRQQRQRTKRKRALRQQHQQRSKKAVRKSRGKKQTRTVLSDAGERNPQQVSQSPSAKSGGDSAHQEENSGSEAEIDKDDDSAKEDERMAHDDAENGAPCCRAREASQQLKSDKEGAYEEAQQDLYAARHNGGDSGQNDNQRHGADATVHEEGDTPETRDDDGDDGVLDEAPCRDRLFFRSQRVEAA